MEELRKLYYDPKRGFLSADRLYEKAKEMDINVSRKQVKEFIKNQKVSQIFKPIKNRVYYQIKSKNKGVGNIVSDLLDLSNYKHENNGYKYLLNIIDIWSRFVWSYTLKTKTPKEIAPKFIDVIEKIKQMYPDATISATTDAGGEFMGEVQDVFDTYDIDHYVANPSENTKRRTSHIESFNKTLLNLLKRYMLSQNSLRYIDALPDLIYNYNHSKHRTTKVKPIDVWRKKVEPKEKYRKIKDNLEVGDYVRHELGADIFTKKGREPKYSDKVYEIVWRNGIRYILRDINTKERLKTLYLPRQLQKVNMNQVDEKNQNLFSENKKISKENRKLKEEAKELDLDVDESKKKIKVAVPASKRPNREKREAKPSKALLEMYEQK